MELARLAEAGVNAAQARRQLELFDRGIPPIRLVRPATVGDGIKVLSKTEIQAAIARFDPAQAAGRMTKFVPSSGAATRMFKSLAHCLQSLPETDQPMTQGDARKEGENLAELAFFITGLRKKRFAFFDDLRRVMDQAGYDIEQLISRGAYRPILDFLLTRRGLDYENIPKALVKVHRLAGDSLTFFEEHLLESLEYIMDQQGVCRIHFTIPPGHDARRHFEEHWREVRERHSARAVHWRVSFSEQKPSTQTLAVDEQNRPFRVEPGRILLMPSGHGALLENLGDLSADLVFIKNIDNVMPQRLRGGVVRAKKILGGHLLGLQQAIFDFLPDLNRGRRDRGFLDSVIRFCRRELFLPLPPDFNTLAADAQRLWLFEQLNRPLRVCGMIRNRGEPGGGPFWIREKSGRLRLQIVEASQVDADSPTQKKIHRSATHFNPVDMICGLTDFRGNRFDLRQLVDPESGFISCKSWTGSPIKVLELPGLWNGAMADWLSVFVEVPTATFAPVKTVNDLLRPVHAEK